MPDVKFNKVEKLTRLKIYGEDNPICKLPECDEVVCRAFMECGLFSSGGMSIAPLTWSEVKAYSDLSRQDLTAWEAENVMMMSREYCSFSQKAKDWVCVQPYWPEMDEDELEAYRDSISRISGESERERDQNGNLIEEA